MLKTLFSASLLFYTMTEIHYIPKGENERLPKSMWFETPELEVEISWMLPYYIFKGMKLWNFLNLLKFKPLIALLWLLQYLCFFVLNTSRRTGYKCKLISYSACFVHRSHCVSSVKSTSYSWQYTVLFEILPDTLMFYCLLILLIFRLYEE